MQRVVIGTVGALLQRCAAALVVGILRQHGFARLVHQHPAVVCVHAVLKQRIASNVVAGHRVCRHVIGRPPVRVVWIEDWGVIVFCRCNVLYHQIATRIANP